MTARVQNLILRMVENPEDPNILAACCGSLTILSRTDELKQKIARDGLDPALQAMQSHHENAKIQEAGCDLLWSLAFNNTAVKENIRKSGGVVIVLEAMKNHMGEAEMIKSALGTLSNLCQIKETQKMVGHMDGIQVIIAVIQLYNSNIKILPMAIDTLASIMVGHRENSIQVENLGGIHLISGILDNNRNEEVLKSGCHALAILSDVPGYGKLMAAQNIIQTITRCMQLYPQFNALLKIATVVLLRVLNEAKIAAQMIRSESIALAFNVIHANAIDEETCAAACHILYELTEYAVVNKIDLEQYCNAGNANPQTLVAILQRHGSTHSIVRTVFRIFSNFAKNAVVLERFITMRSIETLLGVVLTQSKVTDVIDCTVTCICALRPDEIDNYSLEAPDLTLSSLLICFRARSDNLKFVSLTFRVLYKWIREEGDRIFDKNAISMSGFVGAATRCLSRFMSMSIVPIVETKRICLFMYGISSTKHGCNAILTCGGLVVFKKLHLRLKGFERAADLVNQILNRLSNPPTITLQDDESLNQMEKRLFQLPSVVQNPSTSEEDEGSGADDDSEDDESDCLVEKPQVNDEDVNTINEEPAVASETPRDLKPLTFTVVNEKGIHFPKHPMKDFVHPNQTDANHFDLDAPVLLSVSLPFPEKCNRMEPFQRVSYVEESMRRRLAFRNNIGTTMAQIVYESASAAGMNQYSRLHVPYPYQIPPSNPTTDESFGNVKALTFDSEFESGNLLRAIRIGPYEYDLVLRADLHTNGFMQWFYFAVSNVSGNGQKYRFNIVNLCKPDSLFNHGLQPVVYSVRDAATQGKGWHRSGERVCYYDNPFPRDTTGTGSNEIHRTLSFTLHLFNSQDTYLIAHSYPYTVTEHRGHITSILNRKNIGHIFRRRPLCLSLGGLECDLLTITDFMTPDPSKKKKTVVLSSRVHPGEAQASWMMRGAIDFLVGDSKVAQILRQMYVFRIVPMLNPDGVFYGNNRCGLSACDLNRQWKRPDRAIHPTISCTKGMIRSEKSASDVILYCDIHGHSRKKNVFMYGCDTKKRPNPKARVFPKVLSDNAIGKQYVSFSDCSFHVNKGREATARAVVARELMIGNSFTLEASFCGSDFGIFANTHFSIAQLLDVGRSLCCSLFDYSIPDPTTRSELLEESNLNVWKSLDAVPKTTSKKKKKIKPGITFNGGSRASTMQDLFRAKDELRNQSSIKTGFLPKSVSASRRIRTACKSSVSSGQRYQDLAYVRGLEMNKAHGRNLIAVQSRNNSKRLGKTSRATTALMGTRRSSRDESLPDVW